MAMEFLAFDDQFVSDDQKDNLVFFDIIEDTEVSCAQLKLSERIRAQALDCFGGRRWLIFQPSPNGGLENALLTCGQCSELAVRDFRDRDLERHAAITSPDVPRKRCVRLPRPWPLASRFHRHDSSHKMETKSDEGRP
jgi:hypothetical protein